VCDCVDENVGVGALSLSLIKLLTVSLWSGAISCGNLFILGCLLVYGRLGTFVQVVELFSLCISPFV
jgi:hypothetical protein